MEQENKKLGNQSKINSYGEFRTQAQNHYTRHYLPIVKAFEIERLNEFKKAINYVLSSVAIVAAYFIITLIGNYHFKINLSTVIVLMGVFAYFIIRYRFLLKIQDYLIEKMCILLNTKWQYEGYDSSNIYKDSCITNFYNKEIYKNLFSGTYRGIPFEMMQTKFQNKNTIVPENVFKGVLIKIKLIKKFKIHSVIQSKLINYNPPSNFIEVPVNNSSFASNYVLYSTNVKDPQQMITNELVESIRNIERCFDTRKTAVAFYGNEIVIAVNTNDNIYIPFSFEKSIINHGQYMDLFEKITAIYKFIDYWMDL